MSQEDLKARLKSWLHQEMQQHSLGLPAKILEANDFKPLCVGPNAAVWKWVVSHVYSMQSVRNMQGNLTLKKITSSKSTYKVRYGDGNTYDETVSDLLKRRAELTGEITSTLRDIGILEHDLDRLGNDMSETEDAYQKQMDVTNNIRRKAFLNEAFSTQTEYTAAQYKEYQKHIDNKVNMIRAQAEESLDTEEMFSKETSDILDNKTSTLETASSKNVRECCQNIGEFLKDASQGAFHGDKSAFAKRKEPLWTHVNEISSGFSPEQLLSSLQLNVRDSTTRLKEMTSRVDIRRDAQNLRFKYDPHSEMEDLSSQPSLLKSVHELLQDRANEHLQRYIEIQKYTNNKRNTEDSLKKFKAQIEKYLSALSKKSVDVKSMRALIEVEMELDGQRSSLHCLNKESNRLHAIVEKSIKQKQELYTKYRRIQEFQELTDKKQALIQVLVKQNINSQSRIESQISEIEDYINRCLRSHEQHISEVSNKLEHSVKSEVNEFANLVLPFLMFSQMDAALKTSVADLSIYQTAPSNIRPQMVKVLTSLKFSMFQSPEMILRTCLELKNDIEDLMYRMELEKTSKHLQKCQGESGNIAVEITDLCDQLREENTKLLNKLLPVLQQRISKTNNSLADCKKVESLIMDWWTQPGQECVPWMNVDGHMLQEYMRRWTTLVTSLRQRMVT